MQPLDRAVGDLLGLLGSGIGTDGLFGTYKQASCKVKKSLRRLSKWPEFPE
jgi:hypothetical protein